MNLNNVPESVVKDTTTLISALDLDFTTANLILTIVSAQYTDNPIEALQGSKALLEERIAIVTKLINDKRYNKKQV